MEVLSKKIAYFFVIVLEPVEQGEEAKSQPPAYFINMPQQPSKIELASLH